MLIDVGAQPSSGDRETLHLFDVIATDSLGRVHIQITATKPNDNEIRPVLKLNDARVTATVQVALHTFVEARRSPSVRGTPALMSARAFTKKAKLASLQTLKVVAQMKNAAQWRRVQNESGGADGARTRDLRRDRPAF
jgi:hypothetical protein